MDAFIIALGRLVGRQLCGLHSDSLVYLRETSSDDGHLATHAVLSLLTNLTLTFRLRLHYIL